MTHRTHEHRSKNAAAKIKTPEALRDLLRSFSPAHREGLLARLRPHLRFEAPKP